MGAKCFGEFVGNAVLVLLGDGVLANVLLRKSKAEGAGWLTISTGSAFAIVSGVFAAIACGSLDPALNPAVTLGVAIRAGAGSPDRGRTRGVIRSADTFLTPARWRIGRRQRSSLLRALPLPPRAAGLRHGARYIGPLIHQMLLLRVSPNAQCSFLLCRYRLSRLTLSRR